MNEVMTNQAEAIAQIREQIIDMMNLVHSQLEKTQTALNNLDQDLANEVLHVEKKVNAAELNIDKECENFLALYNPLAIDLRFVLATLTINTQLERIGDHAGAISDYLVQGNIDTAFSKEILKDIQFDSMFETAISMVDDAIYSFINEDTKIAGWVFGKDYTLNKINKEASGIIEKFIKKQPKNARKYLYLFSIMKKIERIGDLAKNIAEETIFLVDAKYIKHKNKKKILKKTFS